jgi:putative peptide zinc metalloprotease protein
VAAVVWLTSDPGFVKQLSYTTMVVCTVHTLLFNGNPLLRFDGYYILSDLVEIPNMRQKASGYLGYLFDRYLMGIEKDPPAVQEDEKQTLFFYAVLRVIYRIFIIVSIGFFLYSLFEPLGVFMWLTSAYGMVIMPVYRHGRDLARHYRRGAVKVRYMLILGLVLAAVGGLWFMPMDYSVKTPVVVVPETLSVVRTPVLSRVEEVLVEEGQEVEEGETLARLNSPRLLHRVEQVEEELAAARVRLRKTLDEAPAEHKIYEQEEEKLKKELADLQKKVERLTVRAPHDGTVVNVHRLEMKNASPQQDFVEFPTQDASRELSEFAGLTLEAGTGLMAVASAGSIRFQSYVYEYDMSFLSPGDRIKCVLRNLPLKTFESRVEGVRPVDVKSIENVGITLADVGHIPVKPTREGRQKPLVTLYRLRTELESNTSELPVGLTGKARVIYGRGPAGHFFFRQIVRALRLRLQKV